LDARRLCAPGNALPHRQRLPGGARRARGGRGGGLDSIRGTYINAFYEIRDVRYGEKLYGFPETQQVMVNVPDAQTVRLWAEDEAFSMFPRRPSSARKRWTCGPAARRAAACGGRKRETCAWKYGA
jgi:hypothetical protein